MAQPQKAEPLRGEVDHLAKTHNILSGNPDHGKILTPVTQSNQQPRLEISVKYWILHQPVCTNNQATLKGASISHSDAHFELQHMPKSTELLSCEWLIVCLC